MVNMDSIDKIIRRAVFLSVIILAGCTGLEAVDTKSLFLPKFRRSEVFGFVAGFGTTFAALPDLIKMLKRRSSKGMNPMMAGIMGGFQILWIYYGLLGVLIFFGQFYQQIPVRSVPELQKIQFNII